MEKLDLKDRKIIYELDFDARMSLTQLGMKVGLSKQALKYRLENLQKKNIIKGFYTDVNPSKLGMSIYLVYINFHQITPEIEKRLINHASKQKSVGVNTTINGKWDYCVGIWAESVIHFKNYYKKIMGNYEKYVKEKTIMIETEFYYLKPRQIIDKASEREIKMEGDIERFNLDERDRIILSLLSKNSRISLVDIASKVELTANGVKERIKNLENKGIILGYRVMIDYKLLDFLHYRIFLHFNNVTEEKEEKIMNLLRKNKANISITKTIGFCDLEFRAILENIDEFFNLMEELKREFPDLIKDYDSIIYYKFHDTLNYFPFKE